LSIISSYSDFLTILNNADATLLLFALLSNIFSISDELILWLMSVSSLLISLTFAVVKSKL